MGYLEERKEEKEIIRKRREKLKKLEKAKALDAQLKELMAVNDSDLVPKRDVTDITLGIISRSYMYPRGPSFPDTFKGELRKLIRQEVKEMFKEKD